MELLHADICGPIDPISNGGKRYLLCFIDDFSRKAWAYLLSQKSEALECFKQLKLYVEKETGVFIKCLRTDRGGEFNSSDFKLFCEKEGIRRQLTTAYTPHQNGVAERKNRTVMNMVRCMLAAKKVPKSFWPEAVKWTFYILNRSPTLAVKNITSLEAWSGIKPSVDHFKIWGSVAHVHIPDNKRGKLDDKSFPCIFLGVSDESKGYHLYDPISKKIVVSKDVVFEEEKAWDWGSNFKAQIDTELTWGDDGSDDESNEENEDVEQSEINTAPNEGTSNTTGGRLRKTPTWMRDYESGEGLSEEEETTYMVTGDINDPLYFEDAVKEEKWKEAMDKEINSIEKNNTWSLTHLPKGAKRVGVKWIYKTKRDEHGDVIKHKARLVAKGYAQREGVDYTEVYAPVARLDTVRVIIALAASKKWNIYQLDVKSAFLHGNLNEKV